jgi:hypothetical protein
MLPREKELTALWKDRPFSLVGVNSDQGGRDALRKIVEKEGITWRNAVEGNTSGPVATAWNVRAWPTVYLIDADGVIRWKGHGGEWEGLAGEWIERAAKNPPAGGPLPTKPGGDGKQ